MIEIFVVTPVLPGSSITLLCKKRLAEFAPVVVPLVVANIGFCLEVMKIIGASF